MSAKVEYDLAKTLDAYEVQEIDARDLPLFFAPIPLNEQRYKEIAPHPGIERFAYAA